jgi:hypothetical protein
MSKLILLLGATPNLPNFCYTKVFGGSDPDQSHGKKNDEQMLVIFLGWGSVTYSKLLKTLIQSRTKRQISSVFGKFCIKMMKIKRTGRGHYVSSITTPCPSKRDIPRAARF